MNLTKINKIEKLYLRIYMFFVPVFVSVLNILFLSFFTLILLSINYYMHYFFGLAFAPHLIKSTFLLSLLYFYQHEIAVKFIFILFLFVKFLNTIRLNLFKKEWKVYVRLLYRGRRELFRIRMIKRKKS